ncbi:MAG: amino acid permease [Pirellulales bacterium]|nr:amino acid permease [Pirellulales bacterium]
MAENTHPTDHHAVSEDVQTLHRMGYAQELARCLSGFSNFAISLSIICILAGGLTSFHIGYCSVGGAAIGLGWPAMCLLSLAVAATMGQIASSFPTAGGLYHWASILGGRGWGWGTAWFNLAGLVTVLAAINVGTYRFTAAAFFPNALNNLSMQFAVVAAITCSQAIINHLGIRVTRILTDFSGWWILFVSAALTLALVACSQSFDFARLVSFNNYSGLPTEAPIWPATHSLPWLFALGLLLPAYTITGFDASAHASEETIGAATNVPRGIVRSVLVSGIFGWAMLCAIVLAMPNPAEAALQGENTFVETLRAVSPGWLANFLLAGAALAQYFCGLATVTSASRMAFAFARDGGLPASHWVRWVSPTFRTPPYAIWGVSLAALLFVVYSPIYSTITAVCVIFLYVSYVLPTAIGVLAYRRWWTKFGPWTLGIWFRPLGIISIAACVALIAIGMQPPNDKAFYVLVGMCILLAALWFARARKSFAGPPHGVLSMSQRSEIEALEAAVHEGE